MPRTRVPEPIKRLISRFDEAVQNYAFCGSAHPDDRPIIDHEYAASREALERAIADALDAYASLK